MEPVVIDEEMLQKAVLEQLPAEYPDQVKREASEPAQITALRLDYRNILRIDNLWSFEKLTKLQLDNNTIEKIENLDHLVHLQWLDLSFNRIKCISGLDKLVKLTDLSLFSNQISVLENMDVLKESLQVLSIGKNDIKDMHQLSYLIPFKALQVLNMQQNPFCAKDATDDWKSYTLAHLRHLKYLDYRLVEPDAVRAAEETFKEAIQAIDLRNAVLESEAQQLAEKTATQQQLEEAHIGTLHSLFDALFDGDVSIQKLKCLDPAALAALKEDYAKVFAPIIQDITQHAIQNRAARQAEIAEINECLVKAYASLNVEQQNMTKAYLKHQKVTLATLETSSLMSSESEALSMQDLRTKLEDLVGNLMHHDNLLVEQVQVVLGEFDANFTALCQQGIKQGSEDFQRLREADKRYQAQLATVTNNAFEKASIDQNAINSSDGDLREIIQSRETFTGFLDESEQFRSQKIEQVQAQLISGISAERDVAVVQAQTKETNRHWHRVAEIGVIQNKCQSTLAEYATAA